MPSLLLGCGNSREKIVRWENRAEWVQPLVTLDMNPRCEPDVLWDLEKRPLPFEDGCFDEIGCYNAMEHWGRQGDWKGWFEEMGEYHRLLKDGGIMSVMVPTGLDALADPGHTRFFHPNYFGFLDQHFYTRNLEKKACVTDYRWYWKKHFRVMHLSYQGNHHFSVVIRKEAP